MGKWFTAGEVALLHKNNRLLSPDVLDIAVNSCVSCVIGMQVVAGSELTSENIYVGLTFGTKQKRSVFEQVVHAAQFGRTGKWNFNQIKLK